MFTYIKEFPSPVPGEFPYRLKLQISSFYPLAGQQQRHLIKPNGEIEPQGWMPIFNHKPITHEELLADGFTKVNKER